MSRVLFLAVVLGWLALYGIGLVPWLGHESVRTRSTGFGGIAVTGEERVSHGGGIEDFFFVRGQEVFVDYEVEVRAGSLMLHVFRALDVSGDGAATHIDRSGRGRWTTTIPSTGLYTISIGPSVARGPGQGWDLDYEVTWGASPPPLF